MATDLVSEITGVVSQEISSRIAASLGVDKATVQQAVNAVVPTLLAALMSYVSKPGAAAKLNQVVAKQEPGMLSSLASVIGEPGQKALVDQGASVLTSLLGGKTFSALTGAVDQYAGIGGQGSKTLMGLLGPVVLGVLGRQQREKGLDASGLANLLTSQKSNVVSALPSGFTKYLGDTGILDDFGTAPKVTSLTPAASSSMVPWLLGGVLLLALGALLWHLNQRPLETASVPAAQYGTAEEAKAMLEKAVAAVKEDKAKALDMINKGEGGFKDRDLYVSCANASDGIVTAHPYLRGEQLQDIKGKKGYPLGQEMMQNATEGTIKEVAYWWPRPGTEKPLQKTNFYTKVGDQICGVGYYKD